MNTRSGFLRRRAGHRWTPIVAAAVAGVVALTGTAWAEGPIPLIAPCSSPTVGACTLRLRDSDVVLVNERTPGLRWSAPEHGLYQARQTIPLPVPGAPPVSLVHGWASVEAKHHGVPFRFVTTHLETERFPAVQRAQASEFLAGPAAAPGTVVAVGDFNSAADGSSTDTYPLLTGRFRDAWTEASPGGPGHTCCQSAGLNDPAPQLTSRIDLVLLTGAARAGSARVVGAEPFRAAAPRYTSDHAGVAVTVDWQRPAPR